tara:strand:- start:1857 stop:2222 length:366 start_codon:yes stop_codon:yes gene_type:complete
MLPRRKENGVLESNAIVCTPDSQTRRKMMSEGSKIITGNEMIEMAKNLPSNGVWWEHDKNCITAHKEVKGKKRELYWIDRKRCKTKDQQIDWILQIAGKIWGDPYKFTAALKKACQDWNVW